MHTATALRTIYIYALIRRNIIISDADERFYSFVKTIEKKMNKHGKRVFIDRSAVVEIVGARRAPYTGNELNAKR